MSDTRASAIGVSGRAKQGSALIITLSLVMVFSGLVAAMIMLQSMRDRSEMLSAERLARMYAVESGLERAKLEVKSQSGWLASNLGKPAAVFSNGDTSFAINGYTVQVAVSAEGGGWFLMSSTATGPGGSTTVAVTGKDRTYFSDYARFVHNGNLEIGDYASYGAKVHANGHIGVTGQHITFYDDVTCTGKISYSAKGKDTVTFYKSATPGVPHIDLPGIDELKGLASSAPAGATEYVWDDPAFAARFNAATGMVPTADMKVEVALKGAKMDVISSCYDKVTKTTKKMTDANVDVPHDGTLYSTSQVTVGGNLSRRMSIVTPKPIYMKGAIRYVDDSGEGQWVLRDKDTKVPVGFDPVANSWSMMGNWNGPAYEYVEADDWEARMPVVDAQKVNPSLGLVTVDRLYITGEAACRELHAAIFSSGDVIRSDVGGKKQNLWIHGCIITAGTNPVSSFFSYRTYAYDPHLYGNPPPGFPGGDAPKFANWHMRRNAEGW